MVSDYFLRGVIVSSTTMTRQVLAYHHLVLLVCLLLTVHLHFIDSLSNIVVIGKGRLGSFWLEKQPQSLSLDLRSKSLPQPKDVLQQLLRKKESTIIIIVCVPSSAWAEIYTTVNSAAAQEGTKVQWIFCGNGLPPVITARSSNCSSTTAILPHFAILNQGECPRALSSGPPTLVYGPLSTFCLDILRKEQIPCERATDWKQFQKQVLHKQLWASCMWLLCHDHSPNPLTLQQVLIQRRNDLERLLNELLTAVPHLRLSSEDALAYIVLYSEALPVETVPSKKLALQELSERNLYFYRENTNQVYHRQLLRRVVGSDGAGPYRSI